MEPTLLLLLALSLHQSPDPSAPARPDGAHVIGNGVSSPTVKKQVRPKYTQDAKDAGIEGVVILQAVVLPNGHVTGVHVVKSLDTRFGLDNQAVKAAKEWRFNPGERYGKPVAVIVTIELTFTLK